MRDAVTSIAASRDFSVSSFAHSPSLAGGAELDAEATGVAEASAALVLVSLGGGGGADAGSADWVAVADADDVDDVSLEHPAAHATRASATPTFEFLIGRILAGAGASPARPEIRAPERNRSAAGLAPPRVAVHPAGVTVNRDDLEANLARIREEVGDPRGGIYGPGSLGWEIDREAILFAGAGAAALLQLAHPFVAEAIAKQSVTRSDPLSRFARTFDHVYRIVFGDLDEAFTAARRVHQIHERIGGTLDDAVGTFEAGARYSALDEDAVFWVHATLVHTAADVFERIVRPLRHDERDRYYRGSLRFAALFGVQAEACPHDWRAFEIYFQRTLNSGVVAPSRAAREIAKALLEPLFPSLRPVAKIYRVVTAGLLPEELRAPYELPFGEPEAAIYGRALFALRGLHRTLPAPLRYVPAYHDAVWRVQGRRGPSPMGRLGLGVAKLIPKAFRAASMT
jgi:uncharacterized protein (DUF2236 family)